MGQQQDIVEQCCRDVSLTLHETGAAAAAYGFRELLNEGPGLTQDSPSRDLKYSVWA